MPVPKNKEELLEEIKNNYANLKIDLTGIPEQLTIKKDLDGHAKGTQMSVCNLLAYLIGWGELVLKWDKKSNKGELVDFPETGYKWNELGKLAQKFYSDYETLSFPSLLTKLEEVVHALITLVESSDNTALYETSWHGKHTKGKMVQLNSSSPYKNARTRIRKWKKLSGLA